MYPKPKLVKEKSRFIENKETMQEEISRKKDEMILQLKAKVSELEEKLKQLQYGGGGIKSKKKRRTKKKEEQEEEKEESGMGKILEVGLRIIQRKFEDDPVIKDLNDTLIAITKQINEETFLNEKYEKDLESLKFTIMDLNKQFNEVKLKEKEILSEKARLEKALQSKSGDPESVKLMIKNNNELLMANDNVRNITAYQKGEMEDRRNKLSNLLADSDVKVDELKKKRAMYKSLILERQKTITNFYVDAHRSDLLRITDQLYSLFHELKRTNYHRIISENEGYKFKSFADLLQLSNLRVKDVLRRIQELIQTEEDMMIHEFTSKMFEIFEDNAKVRLKCNDYIEAVMHNTTNRLEEFYLEDAVKEMQVSPNIFSKFKHILFSQEVPTKDLDYKNPTAEFVKKNDLLAKKERKKQEKEEEKSGATSKGSPLRSKGSPSKSRPRSRIEKSK